MNPVAAIGYGVLVGLALGTTGGGGSIVTLPVLVYAIGEGVHTAIGTSLPIVGGIATQGFLAQRERVDWRAGLALGAIGIAGSVPGSLLAARVPGRALLLAFACVMIVAAIAMMRRRPEARANARHLAWRPLVAAGVGLGFLTGFLGVGGGFLIVPTLVFALGFPMREAIATSLLVIAINAAVSLAARASHVAIDWRVAGLLLAGGLAGSVAGARIARDLDQRRLRAIFAAFVLALGAFTAASALGVLPVAVR